MSPILIEDEREEARLVLPRLCKAIAGGLLRQLKTDAERSKGKFEGIPALALIDPDEDIQLAADILATQYGTEGESSEDEYEATYGKYAETCRDKCKAETI